MTNECEKFGSKYLQRVERDNTLIHIDLGISPVRLNKRGSRDTYVARHVLSIGVICKGKMVHDVIYQDLKSKEDVVKLLTTVLSKDGGIQNMLDEYDFTIERDENA